MVAIPARLVGAGGQRRGDLRRSRSSTPPSSSRRRRRDLERLLPALLRRRAAEVRPPLRQARPHVLLLAGLRGVRELLPVVAAAHPVDSVRRTRRHGLDVRYLARYGDIWRTTTRTTWSRDVGVYHGTGNWVFISGDACGIHVGPPGTYRNEPPPPVDPAGAAMDESSNGPPTASPPASISWPEVFAPGTCRFPGEPRGVGCRRISVIGRGRGGRRNWGWCVWTGARAADPRGRRVALVVPGAPAGDRRARAATRAAARNRDPRRRLWQRPQHGRPRSLRAPSPGSRSPTRASQWARNRGIGEVVQGRSRRRRSR